jgi:hypothetical protein
MDVAPDPSGDLAAGFPSRPGVPASICKCLAGLVYLPGSECEWIAFVDERSMKASTDCTVRFAFSLVKTVLASVP